MYCPACAGKVEDGDWLCPFCEHILDPSFLGLEGEEGAEGSQVRAERTRIVAWDSRAPSSANEEPPDAMILGDVDVSEREFSVVQGPVAQKDGRTSTFLFYTSGATSRIIQPDAVPRLTQKDATIPRTPYEDFILSCIDGTRTVRQIQRASGLAPQEVVITLLTLLDKNVIVIGEDRDDEFEEQQSTDFEQESDATVDAYQRGAVPESDLEDLPSVTDFEEVQEIPPTEEEPPRADEGEDDDSPTGEIFDDPFRQPLEKSSPRHHATSEQILPRRRRSSVRKRWASNSPAPIDADNLIEGETPAALDRDTEDSSDQPPVMPQDLDESDSEMVTDHGAPPAKKPRHRTKSPILPRKRTRWKDEDHSKEMTREVSKEEIESKSAQRKVPPLPPPLKTKLERAVTEGTPKPAIAKNPTPPPQTVRAPTPKPVVPKAATPQPQLTPAPPLLDLEFLVEVPKSVVVPRNDDTAPPQKPIAEPPAMMQLDDLDNDSSPIVAGYGSAGVPPSQKMDQRRVLEQAMKRGPIEERDRRKPGAPDARRARVQPAERPDDDAVLQDAPPPARRLDIARISKDLKIEPATNNASEAVAPAAPPPPAAPPVAEEKPKKRKVSQIDGARMAKAQKLFDEALKDKADGNIVSARMNMKLALTFDPTNELYQKAFDEISKQVGPGGASGALGPSGRSRARDLYDQATRAEEIGNVDEAIELLEKALGESKEAAFYNRLGVILAMKKREFARAQELIETALQLAPGNTTYQHNLGKVLSMAAAHDVEARQGGGGKKQGLLGFLGRRK